MTRIRNAAVHVRFLAWEFPEVSSVGGTALARRIGQLAHGLAGMGFQISVVHCQHVDADTAALSWQADQGRHGGLISRRAVAFDFDGTHASGYLARKFDTVRYAIRHGDRTGRWADSAWEAATDYSAGRPDAYIAFFTPRGPLALAAAIREREGIPWIADLQDPWWEGSRRSLRPFVAEWMRRTLTTASKVVQVSPEWALDTSRILRKTVISLRHAVPSNVLVTPGSVASEDEYTLLYAGSLNESYQDVGPLAEALGTIGRTRELATRAVLNVASNAATWEAFKRAGERHGSAHLMRWLGWLSTEDLRSWIRRAQCIVVVPVGDAARHCVPSKLFEFVAYNRPVLLAGPDSGGISSLLAEWGHTDVVARTARQVEQTLRLALRGDTRGMLDLSQCSETPLREDDLVSAYAHMIREAKRVARQPISATST